MIFLKNPGEIDLGLLQLMGVNVKESDNPIGRFGTGMKYAIAVFMREQIPLTLWVGEKVWRFHTIQRELRGKTFDVCAMTGPSTIELGFTTELGRNWEVWQAYRELHSNCLDEGGSIHRGNYPLHPGPMPGTTVFVLPDIDTSGIFLADQVRDLIYEDQNIQVFDGESKVIYYKGIRAKDLRKPSKFTYNILRESTLTEDRLLCYDWQIEMSINQAVVRSENEDFIRKFLQESDHYESTLHMECNTYVSPGETFMRVFNESPAMRQSSVREYVNNFAPKPPKTRAQKRAEAIERLREVAEEHGLEIVDTGPVIKVFGRLLVETEEAA